MSYAALDILIPLHTPNISLLERCMASIDRYPPGCVYRTMLLLDGLTRSERAEVEGILRQRKPQRTPNPIGQPGAHQLNAEPPKQKPDWVIVDWPGVVYWRGSVLNAVPDRIEAEWLLILPPWIEFTDPRWFGFLQQPFMQAPSTMLVVPSESNAPRGTLAPSQLYRRSEPKRREFGLLRTRAARELLPKLDFDSPESMVCAYARVSEQRAGLRWVAPSVRYNVIEHEEHKPCRESSENQEINFESPSPTTPASSTPTTTDSDGFEGSMPF